MERIAECKCGMSWLLREKVDENGLSWSAETFSEDEQGRVYVECPRCHNDVIIKLVNILFLGEEQ